MQTSVHTVSHSNRLVARARRAGASTRANFVARAALIAALSAAPALARSTTSPGDKRDTGGATTAPAVGRVPEGCDVVDAQPGSGGWAARVRDRKSGVVFVLVAPGTFTMGSPDDEKGHEDDEKLHQVEITKPFYLAEAETTQTQYERVTKKNPSEFKGPDFPVETVTWFEAREFCRAIGGDLPTAAQWEYACRAGTQTTFSVGATIDTAQVNFDGKYKYGANAKKGLSREKPVDVRSLAANAWGFHEMHGNVSEWCLDAPCKEPAALPKQDPVCSEENDSRVRRGGSWNNRPQECRAAYLDRSRADDSAGYIGFRAARALP